MNAMQKALIIKDIKEILRSKQILIPMIIVPAIMMVVMPLALVIGAQYGVSGINGMDYMIKALGGKFKELNDAQLLFEIALNFMFPMLFLLIPVMASSIIGASSFVGEKEHKTMESLLYTPLSIKELFFAKVIGTAVPAFVITILSAVSFGIIINVGGLIYFEKFVFPNLKWLILIFWVSPAVTILAIYFMVLVSAKANTFQEAQQMSVFIILPIIFLLVGQATGLFILNEIVLFLVGTAIFIIGYFLMKKSSAKFIPEKLV